MISLDAIDIDSTGQLKPYNENITDTKPDVTGNKGLLTVTMTNGQSRAFTNRNENLVFEKIS